MPGTWRSAARPSDSGIRRLRTVRPASVTWTRSVRGGPSSDRERPLARRSVAAVVGASDRDRAERERRGAGRLLGGEPALGDQAQDLVERVVRHRRPRRGSVGPPADRALRAGGRPRQRRSAPVSSEAQDPIRASSSAASLVSAAWPEPSLGRPRGRARCRRARSGPGRFGCGSIVLSRRGRRARHRRQRSTGRPASGSAVFPRAPPVPLSRRSRGPRAGRPTSSGTRRPARDHRPPATADRVRPPRSRRAPSAGRPRRSSSRPGRRRPAPAGRRR